MRTVSLVDIRMANFALGKASLRSLDQRPHSTMRQAEHMWDGELTVALTTAG